MMKHGESNCTLKETRQQKKPKVIEVYQPPWIVVDTKSCAKQEFWWQSKDLTKLHQYLEIYASRNRCTTNWLNYVACIRANKVTIDPEIILRTAWYISPNDSSRSTHGLQEIGKQAKVLLSELSIEELKRLAFIQSLIFVQRASSISSKQLKEINIWEEKERNEFIKELNKIYTRRMCKREGR